MLDTFRQDLRYTLRGLRAKPAFTAAVVVTLALGIGANAAMFGIVDRMLFRPPPMMRDPGTAHRLYYYSTYRGKERVGGNQYARYLALSKATTNFSSFAGYARRDLAIGIGDEVREMSVAAVSASFFGFFDAPPALGRYFGATDDALPSGQAVAVISHAMWDTRYGDRRDAIGQKIQIGPELYTIIGVAPAGFAGLWVDQPPAAYIPIVHYGFLQAAGFNWLKKGRNWWETYSWGWMSTMARRKPGVTLQAANAELTNAARQSYEAQFEEQKGPPIETARPHAIAASILSERGPNESAVAKVATWVGGVAIIVLLIACANVANLLLARALRRRREVAVRLALGVSRSRLLMQLFTESLVLALCGGAAGMLVAQWGGQALRAALVTNVKSEPTATLRDPRTILFAGAAALVVGLLTGLAPMVQAQRASDTLVDDLKAGAREGTFHRSRLRAALLVAQAALSVVLLVGAGLFVRSLQQVHHTRLGYDVDPVLLIDLNMRGVKLDSAHADQLSYTLLADAKRIPGVTHASLSATTPFWGTWSVGLYVQGIDTVSRLGEFDLNAVTPEHFATFGTRVLQGRGFTDGDSYTAPHVMVVSEGMARTLWPGRSAIGQCVRLMADTMPCTTVVGIAEDIHQQNISADSGIYTYYLSAPQFNSQGGLALRVAGDARHYVEPVRRALQHDMPGVSYITATPFSQIVGNMTQSWQLGATMFVAFGALALLLAAIGLYSVIAYNVTQRTHEMGVRVALGAQVADVVRLVVSDGVKLGVAGLALGIVVALSAAHWVGPLLFKESPSDPVVFGLVTLTLLMVTIAASWIPAMRAAKVDPQVALRSE